MKNEIIYLSFKRNDGEHIYNRHKKYITSTGALVSYSLTGKFACVTTTKEFLKYMGWKEDLIYEFSEPTYHQIPEEPVLGFLMNYEREYLHNPQSGYVAMSEWKEEISEEELDEIANNFGLTVGDPMNLHQAEHINYAIIGFKAGYRKAMEDK